MRFSRSLAALALLASLAVSAPTAAAVATGCTPTTSGYSCTYGPFPISHGMNEFFELVPSIPEAGYITWSRATVVDEHGDRIDHHLAHLHHAVWLNASEQDATCPSFPDRFFATGKERTKVVLPDGYGYHWGNEDSTAFPQAGNDWVMNAHIDGMHRNHEFDAYIEFNMGFQPESEGALTEITPIWYDIDNCSDSEFTVPAGEGRFRTTWTYGMLQGGSFIAMAGHLHDRGVKLVMRNVTQDERIFTSRALYENPKEPGYLTGMTSFSGLPGMQVEAGDSLKLTAIYKKSKRPIDDAMGIMLGAFVPAP